MVDARDVEQSLLQGLQAIALRCQERPRKCNDWHVVKDFDATNAAKCEAHSAAQVVFDDGFNPDIFKSFKALGRDALGRDQLPRDAVVASLKALRQDSERPSRLNWLNDFAWHDLDASQRARLASMSIGWLARLTSALGYPDMTHWKSGVPIKWQFPDRGLRLEATIDAVTKDGDLVMVGPATDDADAKAAYAAVVFVAARRRVPETLHLVDLSRRKTRALEIAEIVDQGVKTAESAARAVIAASSRDLSGLSRTPSYFTCRECPGLDQCSEGLDLLALPVTVRGGMRVR